MDARARAARVVAIGVRALLAAVLAMPLTWMSGRLVPTVTALSCNGASHDIVLSGPDASPRAGTPTTTIRFVVSYHDTGGCAPSRVIVIVPGAGQATMSATGGSPSTTMTFGGSLSLPVGTWGYRFEASSGTGAGKRTATIDGPGTIVITSPAPTPTATPKPTPTPTTRPTPPPTPKPTATSAPTPARTAVATPSERPTPSAQPTGSPRQPSPAPGGSPGPHPSATPIGGIAIPGGASGSPPADPGTGTAGASSTGLTLPGFGIDGEAAAALATWLLTTTIGVLLFAVFLKHDLGASHVPSELSVMVMNGRRGSGAGRRPSASGFMPAMTGHDAPGAAGGTALPGMAMIAPDTTRNGWRSAGGPADGGTDRAALRFATRAAATTERRTVAYRHVRVSAGPDDVRFAEVARLERHDEVEVIGDSDGYLQVRTPDGVTGWVPRVVVVGSSAIARPEGAPPDSDPGPTPRRRGPRWWRPRSLRSPRRPD